MTGRSRRARTQQGVTLIEVLVVVAITGIIAVPVTSWVLSTLQHQDASQHLLRNAVGTGVLASNFSRDVSSASRLLVHPGGGDCAGAATDDGAGGNVVLSIESGSSSERVVYTQAEASGGEGSRQSLWRRQCDSDGNFVAATEVFERVLPGSVRLACLGSSDVAGPCDEAPNRRVRLLLTPCPVRPAQAAADCDLTGTSRPADIQLHATRRITPGFEDLAGSGPIAQIITMPRSGYRNQAFEFDASASRVSTTATYAWEFLTDGGGTAEGQAVSHTFSSARVHEVRLTVQDGGATNVAVATVEVLNRFPVAKAMYVANGDGTVTFDGRSSTHPDGLDLDYRWSFGNGEDEEGALVTRTFPPGTEGRRRAVLWVTDEAGNSDTDSVVLTFPIVPSSPIRITPTPVGSAGRSPVVGTVGPDLDPLQVNFSTQDGGPDRTWRLTEPGSAEPIATSDATEFSRTFRDGDEGEYLIARIGPDGEPTTEPVPFRVNAAPRAAFDVTVATFGSPTSFRGQDSTDSDGDIVSWRWEFGWPNWTGTGDTLAHIYSNPGTYQVKLTVTDDDGATAEAVRTVQIPGTPPAPPAPSWTGSAVTWARVPGADGYRIGILCTATSGPLEFDKPGTATSVAIPGDYCTGGVARATLSVTANGLRGQPSEQANRP